MWDCGLVSDSAAAACFVRGLSPASSKAGHAAPRLEACGTGAGVEAWVWTSTGPTWVDVDVDAAASAAPGECMLHRCAPPVATMQTLFNEHIAQSCVKRRVYSVLDACFFAWMLGWCVQRAASQPLLRLCCMMQPCLSHVCLRCMRLLALQAMASSGTAHLAPQHPLV